MSRLTTLFPEDDGVTHINIGRAAKTQLGRDLDIYAHRPFEHPQHGQFASVAGYLVWLTRQVESIREVHGFDAVKIAKELPVVKHFTPERFQAQINAATALKIAAHADISQALYASTLPLMHYEVIKQDGQTAVQMGSNGPHALLFIEALRREQNCDADMHNIHKTSERFAEVRHLTDDYDVGLRH